MNCNKTEMMPTKPLDRVRDLISKTTRASILNKSQRSTIVPKQALILDSTNSLKFLSKLGCIEVILNASNSIKKQEIL